MLVCVCLLEVLNCDRYNLASRQVVITVYLRAACTKTTCGCVLRYTYTYDTCTTHTTLARHTHTTNNTSTTHTYNKQRTQHKHDTYKTQHTQTQHKHNTKPSRNSRIVTKMIQQFWNKRKMLVCVCVYIYIHTHTRTQESDLMKNTAYRSAIFCYAFEISVVQCSAV